MPARTICLICIFSPQRATLVFHVLPFWIRWIMTQIRVFIWQFNMATLRYMWCFSCGTFHAIFRFLFNCWIFFFQSAEVCIKYGADTCALQVRHTGFLREMRPGVKQTNKQTNERPVKNVSPLTFRSVCMTSILIIELCLPNHKFSLLFFVFAGRFFISSACCLHQQSLRHC